jgi:hypothetical protein
MTKIIITRAQNGWILEEDKPFLDDEGTYLSQEVFEDEEDENEEYSQANSLGSLLWAAFEQHFQSKRSGGIVLDVKEKGREQEYTDELEEKYHDFGEPFSVCPTVDEEWCSQVVDLSDEKK